MSKDFRFRDIKRVNFNFKDIYEEIKSILFFFGVWFGPLLLFALPMRHRGQESGDSHLLAVLFGAWTVIFLWWYFVKTPRDIENQKKEEYVNALIAIREHIPPEKYIEAMDAYLRGRIDLKDILIKFHIMHYQYIKEEEEKPGSNRVHN